MNGLLEQNPRADADVEFVVQRAMALLARDRYESCAELLIELEEVAGEGRPTIRRPGPRSESGSPWAPRGRSPWCCRADTQRNVR